MAGVRIKHYNRKEVRQITYKEYFVYWRGDDEDGEGIAGPFPALAEAKQAFRYMFTELKRDGQVHEEIVHEDEDGEVLDRIDYKRYDATNWRATMWRSTLINQSMMH